MGLILKMISGKISSFGTMRALFMLIALLASSTIAYFVAHKHVTGLYIEALVSIEIKDKLLDENAIDIKNLNIALDISNSVCEDSNELRDKTKVELDTAINDLETLSNENNQCFIDLEYYVHEVNKHAERALNNPDGKETIIYINSEDNPDENTTARWLSTPIPNDIIMLHVQTEGTDSNEE